MALTIGTFCVRKEGLTPEQFQDHYENKHVPLLLETLKGVKPPKSYKRHYLVRDADNKATVFAGNAEDAIYDCFAEMTFEDQEHFDTFCKAFWMAREVLHPDEQRFISDQKIVVGVFKSFGY